MLETIGLSVAFGEGFAVRDVSLSVAAGEWVMLIGPNGAGKSTLLSAIAQCVPYHGNVRLDGCDARRWKPRASRGRWAFWRRFTRWRMPLRWRSSSPWQICPYAGLSPFAGRRRTGGRAARAGRDGSGKHAGTKHSNPFGGESYSAFFWPRCWRRSARVAAGRACQPSGSGVPEAVFRTDRRLASLREPMRDLGGA